MILKQIRKLSKRGGKKGEKEGKRKKKEEKRKKGRKNQKTKKYRYGGPKREINKKKMILPLRFWEAFSNRALEGFQSHYTPL